MSELARRSFSLLPMLAAAFASCLQTRIDGAERIRSANWNGAERSAAVVGREHPSGPAREWPTVWTIDEVLARIREANPTLGAAEARLAEARAVQREAVAAYLPELSLGLEYLSTDNPSRAFALLLDQQELSLGPGFDATPGTIENWRKEIRLDWPLFAPGRAEAWNAAGEGEESARLLAEAIERRLQNAGLQAWLDLGAARALEDVAREGITVVERRLAETRTRAAEGAALHVDVLRLEVRLALAQQEAAQAGLVVRRAESALNRLLDRAPDAPLVLVDEELTLGAGLPEELEPLLALAEEGRRDLLAAAHELRRASFQSAGIGAERLPRLQLFAAYDIDGPEPGIESELDSTSVGVGLRLPFSARTGARIRQAEARLRGAQEELRATALAIAQEVRDARESRLVARELRKLAESSVGAAEEAYRIVAEAQDAGAATVTDVLEAEDARKRARVRLVAARAGVQLAQARLVAAIGGVR